MVETFKYPLWMLVAGFGVPMFAALNSQLGERLGSPALAAMVLTTVAFTASIIAFSIISEPSALKQLFEQPRHLYFGGFLFAFYIISISTVAPRFGVGNAIFFVLLGQMISATVIDHFGLFGNLQTPVTTMRMVGLSVMASGLFIIQNA